MVTVRPTYTAVVILIVAIQANCYLKQGKYKAAELVYKKVCTSTHLIRLHIITPLCVSQVLDTVQGSERTQSSHHQEQMAAVPEGSPSSLSMIKSKSHDEGGGGWHRIFPTQRLVEQHTQEWCIMQDVY